MIRLARKRKTYKRSSKCPEPINTLLDFAGAATLGLYVKHKVKKDYQNGCGEESAKAAAAVFGMGSLRGGSRGMINLGGLMGLNSALKDIDRQKGTVQIADQPSFVSPIVKEQAIKNQAIPGMWRDHCEDGSEYGISPYDYVSADDYADALNHAKSKRPEKDNATKNIPLPQSDQLAMKRNRWRLYCEDGSEYGIYPEDYTTADDYNDALNIAKKNMRPKDENA